MGEDRRTGAGHVHDAWLAYARRLVHDERHFDACQAVGGSPTDPALDPNHTLDSDLRWPGYLGRDYRLGGVLCVATVHRDFGTNGAGSQVRSDIADGTRRWKAGELTDDQYLESVRRGYEAGLGRWIVGGNFGAALAQLHVPVETIAYVNAARCQYPEDLTHLDDSARAAALRAGKKTKAAVLKLCHRDYPVGDLIDMLRPRVVLFASKPTYTGSLEGLRRHPETLGVCIHPFLTRVHGPLQVSLTVDATMFPEGTLAAEWGPAVRNYLWSAR